MSRTSRGFSWLMVLSGTCWLGNLGAPDVLRSMVFGRRARFAAAGQDAFQREALSWIDGLYGAALRLTRNPDDADDLVQDTYVKAFKSADSFKQGSNLRAWLFTILHNHFLNDRRHANANPVDTDTDVVERVAFDQASADRSAEDALVQQATAEQVRQALDMVPENFREAVWLRDAEGFSYVEIAGMLKVPVGTVMSRISRGRRLLAKRLVEVGAVPPSIAQGKNVPDVEPK